MALVGSRSARPAVTPGLVPIFAATFTLTAGVGTIFALLAELQNAYGFSNSQLGFITGAAFVSSLTTQLLFAGYADRGHTRTMAAAGLVLTIVALVWFAVSTELWQLVAARALSGVATGSYFPASRSTVVRMDDQHVAENLGRLGRMELAGFITGPVIGTSIAESLGVKAPFWVLAAVVALLTMPLLRVAFPKTAKPVDTPRGRPRLAFDLLQRRDVLVAVLLAVALYLPIGVFDSLWARYLEDRGASTLFIGVSLTMYGVPYVLFARMGGRLVDRVGAVPAVVATLPWIIVLVWMYGVLASPWLIMSLGILEAAFGSVTNPGAQSAMARACPPDRLAAGQGLAGAASQATAALVALGAPALYAATGPAVTFGAAATGMAGVTLLAAGLHYVRREVGH